MSLDPKKERQKQKCENCVYWKHGDPLEIHENVGVCTALMVRKLDGPHQRLYPHAPCWAHDSTHRTISWEGQSCPMFVCRHPPEDESSSNNPYRPVN